MKIIAIILALFLQILTTNALSYSYEKKSIDLHVIHILKINPDEYDAEIIKANNGIGRETVSSMSKNHAANIAINAGFFEIGGNRDGVASGTLIIKGKTYHVKKGIQPLVIIKNGSISINQTRPKNYQSQDISLVSGIPMLISHGKIPLMLFEKKSEFYTMPHARTALGINSDGTVIIVVAEHYYKRDITGITMGELQSLIKTKEARLEKKYKKNNIGDFTLHELKQILRAEYSAKNTGTQGLTILKLAKLMQDLGCQDAVNLDGGGSSTLWIEGRVVNNTFGDNDEGIGNKVERPVADAIIFKKMNK